MRLVPRPGWRAWVEDEDLHFLLAPAHLRSRAGKGMRRGRDRFTGAAERSNVAIVYGVSRHRGCIQVHRCWKGEEP